MPSCACQNRTDSFFQVSGGYEFSGGFDASIGYQYLKDEDGDNNHIFGLRLTHTLEFSTAQ